MTAAGGRELERFLAEPMGPDAPRAELLVRLRCAAALDAGTLARMLDAHEQACREELARIDADARAGDALAERLVREQQRLGVTARLAWVDYARAQLRAKPGADPVEPATWERVGAA